MANTFGGAKFGTRVYSADEVDRLVGAMGLDAEAYSDSNDQAVLAEAKAYADAMTSTQADWGETDSNDMAFILNKPSIPSVPSDIGAATAAAATLTARGFGAWMVRETYNNKPIVLVWSSSGWTPYGDESSIGSAKGDAESAVLDWSGEVDAAIDIHATRTANTSGYSEWSVDPPFLYDSMAEENVPASVPAWGECQDPVSGEYVDGWGFAQMYSGITALISTDRNATSLSYEDMGTTFNCVRTRYPGYTLGTQSDKPLAGMADLPAAQVNADWNATGGKAQILNKPTIPVKTSDLSNDSGFATLQSVLSGMKSAIDSDLGYSAQPLFEKAFDSTATLSDITDMMRTLWKIIGFTHQQ